LLAAIGVGRRLHRWFFAVGNIRRDGSIGDRVGSIVADD